MSRAFLLCPRIIRLPINTEDKPSRSGLEHGVVSQRVHQRAAGCILIDHGSVRVHGTNDHRLRVSIG